MSILSGTAIHAAIARGDIQCEPFDPAMLNPASIDLTLGVEVAAYRIPRTDGVPLPGFWLPWFVEREIYHLDSKTAPVADRYTMTPQGIILRPGLGYLMHTAERIGSTRYVPVLDGKSSLGRLFVQIHMTAGYGDPGFFGQWTLEVVVVQPVRLYPGMRIAQMRFHSIEGEVELYSGNYKDDASGPVTSRAWRQFGDR